MQPIAEPWRWVACSVVAVFAFCSGGCSNELQHCGYDQDLNGVALFTHCLFTFVALAGFWVSFLPKFF